MNTEFNSTLVIVPARGGSKRIVNKNTRKINGQPMIYWPLKVLSKLFVSKNILVSTDSDIVKSVVEKTGLIVPFKRPANLSDDFTGTAQVTEHALEWYESNIGKVDFVLTVYPTAVMLSEDDIRNAMKILLQDITCDSVMSATTFPFPIQRAIFKNSNGYAEMFEPSNYSKRSQDFEEAMHDAGQFYLSRVESIRKGRILTNSQVKLCLLNRNRVVDIDTLEDLEIAEEKLRLYKKELIDDYWPFNK